MLLSLLLRLSIFYLIIDKHQQFWFPFLMILSEFLEGKQPMKKLIRKIEGVFVVLPFIIATKSLSIFWGQQKAIEIVGPFATKFAKNTLKLWIPKINGPEDFDSFPINMKKNFWIWRQFYDIQIIEENNDVFKLHIYNCPFCEAFNNLGLSKLSPYICEGDWEIAKENSDKWLFERNYQIGTGDSFCDHTYKRIL